MIWMKKWRFIRKYRDHCTVIAPEIGQSKICCCFLPSLLHRGPAGATTHGGNILQLITHFHGSVHDKLPLIYYDLECHFLKVTSAEAFPDSPKYHRCCHSPSLSSKHLPQGVTLTLLLYLLSSQSQCQCTRVGTLFVLFINISQNLINSS